MRDRKIRKTYRALICGNPERDRFTITQPIGKQPHPVLGYLYAACADGVAAHSECRVLQRYAETSLVEVDILTGRPHQIRIHMAVAGHPLVGDPLYAIGGLPHTLQPSATGNLPVPGDCGYHLHAMQLQLTHPNGEWMNWIAPPPDCLQHISDQSGTPPIP
jgi:23S rRNA pseudouridine1911/1915/1917 synthase